MGKSKKNQVYSSIDSLSIFASFILVIGVASYILHSNRVSQKVMTAKQEARSFAAKLLTQSVKSTNFKPERGVASSEGTQWRGELGMDPWGHTYQYQVIKNSYGQPVYMLVLSHGPNKQLDTKLSDVMFLQNRHSKVQISGDDIAYMRSFR